MKSPIHIVDIVIILIGLVGIVLYWTGVDSTRVVLSGSIALVAIKQLFDFIMLPPTVRSRYEWIKAFTSSAILLTAIALPFSRNNLPILALLLMLIIQQFTRSRMKPQKTL